MTEACRKIHGFRSSHVVLTQLSSGEQVVVMDLVEGRVYESDFEAGATLLPGGGLEPRWSGFGEFLEDFFAGLEFDNSVG